jgi:hypothetical protein
MFEPNTSVFDLEEPVDFRVSLVASLLPGGDFRFEAVSVGNTTVQALTRQDGEFDFRLVEPGAVLGSRMKPQPFADPLSLCGREGFIQ